jgi:O-glycosyl hydrolase
MEVSVLVSAPAMSRRRFLALGALGAAALALPPRQIAAQQAAEGSASMALVSQQPAQTMQGFGASGAWWPNDLVRFRPEVREAVADLLFSPRGIALSVYRYNIGGGGVAVVNPVRAPETFLVSPGVYDWSRDPGGRLFLRLAADRGVPILIGFSNSAPAIWTSNAQTCGGNLQPGVEAAYARYLADVVAHFREAEGIRLSYLSPMNEPDHTFDTCRQEGMPVPVQQRAAVIRAVGQELKARAPYCRVIADESSRTGEDFMREARQWLDGTEVADYLAAFAVHRYDYPNDLVLDLARELAGEYGKPLWSTELCCFDTRSGSWGQQFDPTIKGGLMLANMIWQGLTVGGDAAFHWWVACSSELGGDPTVDPDVASRPNGDGWNDGLLYYDPKYEENGNQTIYVTKRFFALGHFSRYVRPGDRLHEVTGAPANLRVMAFASQPAGRPAPAPVQLPSILANAEPGPGWTLVIVNNARIGSAPTSLRIRLPAAESGGLVATTAVETSERRDLSSAELPSVEASGVLSAQLPPQSITTYVLRPGGG